MKRFRLNFLTNVVAVSALLFTACSGNEKEPDSLTVTPTTNLQFPADNADPEMLKQTLIVETNVKSWTATPSDPSWILVNEGVGTLTVTVVKNTETISRSGTVTVSAGSARSVTVSVYQSAAGGANTLSIIPTSLTFLAGNTNGQNVMINTDASNWDFIPLAEEWLTVHLYPVAEHPMATI